MAKQKIVKCEARKFRAMRRTRVRGGDEKICGNKAVGDFLRRHQILNQFARRIYEITKSA
jgi:hypothetical protein